MAINPWIGEVLSEEKTCSSASGISSAAQSGTTSGCCYRTGWKLQWVSLSQSLDLLLYYGVSLL